VAKIIRKSPAPLYAVAAVWVIWALFFPLYALWHFILAAAVSVAVYWAARRLWRDKVLVLPDPQPEVSEEPASGGNPQIDALVAERDRAVSEMRRLNASIEDEKISAQIDHMEEMTGKIFAYVMENPAKIAQIRRFLNYYLPTTLKLLNAYDRMDDAGVSGAVIDGTKGKIDALLDKVVLAFDRQLDALFADAALDISTEITVMEQMLAREGLSDMQMKSQQ
jgi:hypothetical protein